MSNSPVRKNILILYLELAYYTLKCCEELARKYDVNVHIIRMPVNKVAPFRFDVENKRVVLYDVRDFDLDKLRDLYKLIRPELVICSGWTNKLYLRICREICKETITIIGFDTQWNGSIRQQVGTIYARFMITPYFHYAFVPGTLQAKVAAKLGFKYKQILFGFYAADINTFDDAYCSNLNRSKVLLFAGRFSKEKGVKDLCDVFIELKNAGELQDWQLWCIGTGEEILPEHPAIKNLGFKQPSELKEVMKEPGIFVLPSTYEPWGVVVQEFAAAGFPMICSDAVGSTEVFLENGKNGLLFKAGNKMDLRDKIKKMCNLNAETLMQMSEQSYKLSKKMSPETWADQLYKLL